VQLSTPLTSSWGPWVAVASATNLPSHQQSAQLAARPVDASAVITTGKALLAGDIEVPA